MSSTASFDVDAGRSPTDLGSSVELSVRPATVLAWALGMFGVIMALNLAATPIYHTTENQPLRLFVRFFLFDMEANLPTFFNFCLLLGVALLALVVAARATAAGNPWRRHWLGLGALFLLLAYDEAASLHENLGYFVKTLMQAEGFLSFAWVVPGLIFVVVMGLAYSRFLLAMPRRTAGLILLSGGCYVFGAIVLEMVGADYYERHGTIDTTAYLLLTTVEETFEMGGLMLFSWVLLGLLAGRGGRVAGTLHG